MFGYVTIDKLELKVKDYYKYRAYYCGLCKTLKDRHGRLGQMTLTYDMTFLVLLLTALYESKTEGMKQRCIAHPTTKHAMLVNEITEYAADLNIAMAYYNFKDDWQDDRSVKGLAGAKAFERKYRKIKETYPRQCKVIEESLQELSECEKREEMNLDIVSDCFGKLMGELFVYKEDEWQEPLRNLGNYLGKFIYLIDAYEDLDEDLKENHYNPLKELKEKKDYEALCEEMLTMMMAECARNFEMLPIIEDAEILRNILYTGVWVKYNKMREGKDEREHEGSI